MEWAEFTNKFSRILIYTIGWIYLSIIWSFDKIGWLIFSYFTVIIIGQIKCANRIFTAFFYLGVIRMGDWNKKINFKSTSHSIRRENLAISTNWKIIKGELI